MIPARLAYTARDNKPRVVPIWFHWTGDELVMSLMAGAAKAVALREHPDVALTIDAEGLPADVLLLRGLKPPSPSPRVRRLLSSRYWDAALSILSPAEFSDVLASALF